MPKVKLYTPTAAQIKRSVESDQEWSKTLYDVNNINFNPSREQELATKKAEMASEAEVEALITAADRLHHLTMDNARAAIVQTPKAMKPESAIVQTDAGEREDFGSLFEDEDE